MPCQEMNPDINELRLNWMGADGWKFRDLDWGCNNESLFIRVSQGDGSGGEVRQRRGLTIHSKCKGISNVLPLPLQA